MAHWHIESKILLLRQQWRGRVTVVASTLNMLLAGATYGGKGNPNPLPTKFAKNTSPFSFKMEVVSGLCIKMMHKAFFIDLFT